MSRANFCHRPSICGYGAICVTHGGDVVHVSVVGLGSVEDPVRDGTQIIGQEKKLGQTNEQTAVVTTHDCYRSTGSKSDCELGLCYTRCVVDVDIAHLRWSFGGGRRPRAGQLLRMAVSILIPSPSETRDPPPLCYNNTVARPSNV